MISKVKIIKFIDDNFDDEGFSPAMITINVTRLIAPKVVRPALRRNY